MSDPKSALRLAELYGTLSDAIWSELKTGRDITSQRRNLQREHLARLAGALLRPSIDDARRCARAATRAGAGVATRHRGRAEQGGFSQEAKAHLAEALLQLDEALKAPIVRQAV